MVICLVLRISLGGRAALGARTYWGLMLEVAIHHARGIQAQILVNSGVLAALRPWVRFFFFFLYCFEAGRGPNHHTEKTGKSRAHVAIGRTIRQSVRTHV